MMRIAKGRADGWARLALFSTHRGTPFLARASVAFVVALLAASVADAAPLMPLGRPLQREVPHIARPRELVSTQHANARARAAVAAKATREAAHGSGLRALAEREHEGPDLPRTVLAASVRQLFRRAAVEQLGAEFEPAAHSDYRNPIINADFADPAAIVAHDGYVYVYATQSRDVSTGHMVNVQTKRSRDLVHWETLPDAMPEKPSWAATTQDFWAPHPFEHAGKYYMYFAARPSDAFYDKAGPDGSPVPLGARGMALGVAVSDAPNGPFRDIGQPLRHGPGYRNIDAMVFADTNRNSGGKRLYLYWGSEPEQPVLAKELRPDDPTRFLDPDAEPTAVFRGNPAKPYERLAEAPWVWFHKGWYYMMLSGDNCCGPKAHYAVYVARSRTPMGLFESKASVTGSDSSAIYEANARFLAPGHSALVKDSRGHPWILAHAIDRNAPATPESPISRRPFVIDRIRYEHHWPSIRRSSPSTGVRSGPTFGSGRRND
jgi:arabinan endo-1,5-alpha-L-arabinosidase